MLLAEIKPELMFLAGCALLTAILLKRSYRYFSRRGRRKNSQPIERQPRPTNAWDGVQRDAMAHIERQEVEMHEKFREINGQLASKIVILERLIGQSQRQIEQLESLLGQQKAERHL